MKQLPVHFKTVKIVRQRPEDKKRMRLDKEHLRPSQTKAVWLSETALPALTPGKLSVLTPV